MKKAFTLIEILISVAIVALISGGGLLYLNNFNSQQKLDKSKNEVVSSIKIAQSYAKTRQLPAGSTLPELNYVRLTMSGNYLVAGANGLSSLFFRNVVNNGEITVTCSPTNIYFWAGEGKLSKNTDIANPSFYGVGETAVVNVINGVEAEGSYKIIIDALGQIKEERYAD